MFQAIYIDLPAVTLKKPAESLEEYVRRGSIALFTPAGAAPPTEIALHMRPATNLALSSAPMARLLGRSKGV